MIEPAIIAVRLLQYVGAAILFGSSLFFVYALPRPTRWARPLVASGAALLALASVLAVVAQASLFAGSFAEGLTGEAMGAIVTSMDLGKAAVVRAIAALAAAGLVLILPSRAGWIAAAALGAIATASLAWLGHGAASEGVMGSLHLGSDMLHTLAAAIWLGALICFAALLLGRGALPSDTLAEALARFSGLGPAVVAVLVITGAVNAWVLIGPEQALGLWRTPYGQLMTIKLALFLLMLVLAAFNRFRLTGALRADPDQAIGRISRSIAAETAAGFAILFLVAWLGTLAPPVERF